jgi:hypothetical protein
MRLEIKDSLIDQVPLLYSKDFYQWPEAWMGFDEDLITGEIILKGFTHFIKSLVEEGCSKKTIENHMKNLWFLGSEIIREVHFDEDQRKLSSKKLLLMHINEVGGPAVHQWDYNNKADCSQISSYDRTCSMLFNFIKTCKMTH